VVSSSTDSGLLSAAFLRKLERLTLLVRKTQTGMRQGERRSRRKGTSTEFADYRPYVQGDDLRHVDWNIYGRLGALYLKLFMEQEDITAHMLLDASASMRFGTPGKLAFAKQAAAALGYIALVNYDRVSAEAFGGEGARTLRPCRGKGSARKLFAFLEQIEASGETHLEQDCRRYFLRHRAKGVAVLFSDFFDEAGAAGALRRLQQSGSERYAVHVLAPEEMDPPLNGDLKLVDAETQAFTEVSSSSWLLKRYKQNLAGFQQDIKRQCLARGIGYIPVRSDMDIEHMALDLLRQQGILR